MRVDEPRPVEEEVLAGGAALDFATLEALAAAKYGAKIRDLGSSEFRSIFARRNFSFLEINRFQCSAYSTEVTREALSKPSRAEVYYLNLYERHSVVTSQDGRDAIAPAGSLVLLDSRLPGILATHQGDTGIKVTVPVELWESMAPQPLATNAFVLSPDRTSAKLACMMLRELSSGNDIHEENKVTIARHLIELISLASSESSTAIPDTLHRHIKLRKIKSYIRGNIANPELSPTFLASHFNVSTRYISNLFAAEEASVMQFIWTTRLLRAKELILQRSITKLSIKEISFSVGFKNPSHFTNVFTRRFSISPTEYARSSFGSEL